MAFTPLESVPSKIPAPEKRVDITRESVLFVFTKATFFSFFNYGPHYVPSSSPCSHLPWVHDATRHLTYTTGAVEDRLFGARVMTGDVGLLSAGAPRLTSITPWAGCASVAAVPR